MKKNWFTGKSKKEVQNKMKDLADKATERRKEAFESLSVLERMREEIKKENNDRLLGEWVRKNLTVK